MIAGAQHIEREAGQSSKQEDGQEECHVLGTVEVEDVVAAIEVVEVV